MENKAIGGYFEWEFPPSKEFSLFAGEFPVYVSSCHQAEEYILRGLGKVSKVYVPYFTCDFVTYPIEHTLHLNFSFYHINEDLEIAEPIELGPDEYIIYTNYFGVKDGYISQLVKRYGDHLLVDNAQALYFRNKEVTHQFYSIRKFAGVADGGVALTTVPRYDETLPYDLSNGRCSHLLKRWELDSNVAYPEFIANNMVLLDLPLSRMSRLTERHVQTIDWNNIKERRRENFAHLHTLLGDFNRLKVPAVDAVACPMVYPFWTDNQELRKRLIAQKIYVATYWPNVLEWCKEGDLEYEFAQRLLAIPIDQRYTVEDMEYIAAAIRDVLKG